VDIAANWHLPLLMWLQYGVTEEQSGEMESKVKETIVNRE
jgi:hypothetical protein